MRSLWHLVLATLVLTGLVACGSATVGGGYNPRLGRRLGLTVRDLLVPLMVALARLIADAEVQQGPASDVDEEVTEPE